MMYADFSYYQDNYIGHVIIDEKIFQIVAARASDYMDAVTFGRLENGIPEEHAEKVKKCCCALAENLFYYDAKMQPDAAVSGGTKQSESISKYSVTYSNPLDSLSTLTGGSFETYQYNTALRYLGRTGLMYRGVD